MREIVIGAQSNRTCAAGYVDDARRSARLCQQRCEGFHNDSRPRSIGQERGRQVLKERALCLSSDCSVIYESIETGPLSIKVLPWQRHHKSESLKHPVLETYRPYFSSTSLAAFSMVPSSSASICTSSTVPAKSRPFSSFTAAWPFSKERLPRRTKYLPSARS